MIKLDAIGKCKPCFNCGLCKTVKRSDSTREVITHLRTSTITMDAGEKKIKIEGLEEVMRTINTDTARENMIKRLKGQEVEPGNVKTDAKANGVPLNADSARLRMIETMKHDSRTHKPTIINDPDKSTNNFMSSEAARSRMLSRMTTR